MFQKMRLRYSAKIRVITAFEPVNGTSARED
jgi:hypothetical protein